VELLGHCVVRNEEFRAMIDEGAVLNEYIISGRYPGDIFTEQINQHDAEEALRAAQRIRSCVLGSMSENNFINQLG
jgi:HEPN domain-containing protein